MHQGELELLHDIGNADGQSDYYRASVDSRRGPNNLILDVVKGGSLVFDYSLESYGTLVENCISMSHYD
jgi:hypothetical protein